MYVIHEPSDFSFDKVGVRGKIFSTDSVSKEIQFVLVETEDGHQTKIIEHKSTFCYYVLEGNGYFDVEGQIENCTKGDLIIISPGKTFTYKGKLKLLLVNTPIWTEEQEETVV